MEAVSLERKIIWRPAFDKRHVEPGKNYGVHGVEIEFQLLGEAGGVVFRISTNWMLPHVQAESDARPLDENPHLRYMFHKPQSAGLDGHWKMPPYEGAYRYENCKITGGVCYCDGTSLTDSVFNLLVEQGEEALWKRLEEAYEEWKPKKVFPGRLP